MTKYLKQYCSYEAAVRDDGGAVVLNRYGEPTYSSPTSIRCRREHTTKDVLTTNGSILKSSSVYYTDDSQLIRPEDRLDGRAVAAVEEYINERGQVEGYVSYA